MKHTIIRFHHVGIEVRDIEEEIKFFCEVLGFETVKIIEPFKVVHLAKENGFILELLCTNQHSNKVHFGFSVTNIEGIRERLLKLDSKLIVQDIFKKGNEQIMLIKNAAGIMIELNDGLEIL